MKEDIVIGGLYRHFKGHFYKVLLEGKDADDLSDKIVYENISSGEIWIRDKNEFLSLVDKEKYPNVLQEKRFEFVKRS